MPDFTVNRYGTDTSGRGLFFTAYMWSVWQMVLADPRVRPFASKVTLVQGGFMGRNGGGAATSAGYHDGGGAGDVRTWNLTLAELSILIRVAREYAIALWRRDATHGGMDPHAHWAAGWDQPCPSGIVFQWSEYQSGRDGLASRGRDYEWRPSPLVLTPPNPQEDYMASNDAEAKLNQLIEITTDTQRKLVNFRANESDRDKAAAEKAKKVAKNQIGMLGGVVDRLGALEDSGDLVDLKKQIRALRRVVIQHLADDPDVDGAENPAVSDETPKG